MRYSIIAIVAMATIACNEAQIIDATGVHALPSLDQKSDNYVSTNAREFELTGIAHALMPEGLEELDEATRAQKREAAVSAYMNRVLSSLRSHVKDVVREANGGSAGENDSWFIYVKRNAGEFDNMEVTSDNKIRFNFKLELVGSWYLMSKLAPGEGTARQFDVKVKRWTDNIEDNETITVTIEGSESRDAFPKYKELFADGVFDIAVHFGGDYNEGRHDIETCKWLLEELEKGGWKNDSVTSYDDLKIDSPPYTKTLKVEGKDIDVKVYVYHADMVEPVDEEKLGDAMRKSLSERDIVVYSGHAGSGSGFILDYKPKFEIKASEFETLDLPSKYQIFVMDGCRTYRTYVDDIMKNPNKTFDNLDIVTTVNTTPFGAGYYLLWELIHWFTLTTDSGAHFPMSWMGILRGVNRRSFKSVHYGVHGIDNNPKLNPHQSDGIACKPCESDNQCGAGGNLCLGYPGSSACGIACTTDTACPDGFRCARITDDPKMFYLPKQCVKRDYRCGS